MAIVEPIRGRYFPVIITSIFAGMVESPVNNIEYILQRKATEHKRNGRMDLAIACLRKSNEIMPHSNFMWSKSDYLRLVEYLKICGRFAEARAEETEINANIPEVGDLFYALWEKTLIECKDHKSDLVAIGDSHDYLCAECAQYRNRVYSLSGKDKRFPKLPDFIYKTGCIHESIYLASCSITLRAHAIPDEGYIRIYLGDKDPIVSSNRPFIDDRTQAEKEAYEKYLVWAKAEYQKEQEQQRDRANYDLLCEFLPEIAPKSFGGYRRMKGANTKNYLVLVEKAREKNIILEPDDNGV